MASARISAGPFRGPVIAAQVSLLALSVPAIGAPADLANVRSWGYQLQQIDADQVAASPYDLMVIDILGGKEGERTFGASDLATMQHKPDGSRRIVLAYLSIGEAEDYRPYWQASWFSAPPDWLGRENPDWNGNYTVRYWSPQWQSLIYGNSGAYLDEVIAAGFDGVYLDRIDAFDVPDPTLDRAERMQAMAEFVSSIANYARQQRPDFIVVGQNGEELLTNSLYATAIDAVGKEDLFFGIDGDGLANSKSELRASLQLLRPFQSSGKPVFLVEYLHNPDDQALARQNAAALGVPLFIADRELADVHSR